MKKAMFLLVTVSILAGYDNPKDNPFPGGYISIGYQWGKNSKGDWFRDFQVTGAVLVPLIDPEVIPIFHFVGITVGSRKMIDGTKMKYYDIQLNNVSIVSVGFGAGRLISNGSAYSRRKMWGGISVVPLMITRDWADMNDGHMTSTGGMLVYPVPFFGYAFYP